MSNKNLKTGTTSSRLKMPAVIPGLKGYPGCKGAAGVYQNIISHIPKCNVLVIPFLGHCAITRHIKRPHLLVLNDIDPIVYNCWHKALKNSGFIPEFRDNKNNQDLITVFKDTADGSIIILSCKDAISMLSNPIFKPGPDFAIYCDPPYPFDSRKKRNHIYNFESNHNLHVDLLSLISKMTAKVIISTYENITYKAYLNNWQYHQFTGMTHGGPATETIYYNFNLNDHDLQDYNYLGKNYKDRERIRLKTQRHLDKFSKLPVLERKAILSKLVNKFS